ncbi:MAG: aminopeptidase [Angelakisella sp.]
MKPENMGITLSDQEIATAYQFCDGYKTFLNEGKTEREVVTYTIAMLEKAGYTPYNPAKKYKTGDKVYKNNRGKALIMTTFGVKPITEGVHICASHIDSPRLDFKPRPLFEDAQLAYFKTHYYGGIKKYQWSAIPLSLHGVVMKKDGTSVRVTIGEDPGDPVFCVTDLLPHLAADQMKLTLAEGIKGEQLNILIGCMPFKDDKAAEKVKLNIANLLFEKYGVIESDFLSAELTAVPAFAAQDVGFDRGMIGSYGHDDRVCAYPSLIAELEAKKPAYTTVTIFADKEEIGSEGTTGLASMMLRDYIEDLAQGEGAEVRHVLANSKCLSSDVNIAFDPNFPDVSERRNTSYMNYGVVLTKYTGSRGKSGTNDAPAETVGYFRKLMDDAGVIWQTGELGKVDQGGGGTVAQYVSYHNVDTIDLGVPVLSMHAPYEVVSKCDVYMTYKAIAAFYHA